MSSLAPSFPHPGIQVWTNPHGIRVLRLHYSADPVKTPEWAAIQRLAMPNPADYEQEYEISWSAKLGSLIYILDEEATLEDSFPIPQHWTRRMALDPHPSVPDAFLWVATDPWGDRWYYRELWPSVKCYRYDNGSLRGEPGPCPEQDARYAIKDYVSTVRYLESAENPENRDAKGGRFDERIALRVIDYSARAFAAQTVEGQKQLNFQQIYESHMQGSCNCEPRCNPLSIGWFDDAKKDHQTGEELVNTGLKPRLVRGPDGKDVKRSRIHIFRDRCPELIYELKNARRQTLTPLQVERIDPTGKPVDVRMHLADCFRYLEMCEPYYVEQKTAPQYETPVAGISY